MPLYEYRCTQCGYDFEKIQSFSAQPEQECPQCHGPLERPLTAPALQFKGAGWYVNDYAAKSGKAASGSSSSAQKGTAAAETKTSSAGETTASAPAAAAPASSTS